MSAIGEDAYRAAQKARGAIDEFVVNLTVCAVDGESPTHVRIRLYQTALKYAEVLAELEDWMVRHQAWDRPQ